MKLNPAKCAFGVTAGKFLGFMVHYRGIEANPSKIKVILEMPPPRSIKEVQRLTGRIAALGSSVLVRDEDKVQKSVYYVSKRLSGAEIRYTPIEKLAYALVISARKLRPYFEAHHIIVLSSQPLRHVLGKSDLSGRMLKWAVELSAFDIDYRPRLAIKAQALADFIVEGTLPMEADEGVSQTWTLSVDGSSSVEDSGAGLLLQSPDGQAWPYALHFEFNASNNEAEYETLIAGLKLAEQMEVTGEFEAREDAMAQYLAIAKDLIAWFQAVKINYVPRAQNALEDALLRIAASSVPRNSRAVYMESLPQMSIETEVEQLCVEGGVDIVGPFPLADGQNKYLIAAIDYFTKWVEAEPLATIIGRRVKQFLWKSIICRFDISRVIITDNGTQFEDRLVQEWCRELGIKQHFTSVAHSQANGQVELTNRTILQGLRARVDKADDRWVDELPNILWSYRTMPRMVTGECPFTLCYGSEALILIEIGVTSYRVEHFHPEVNKQGLRCNLDLMDEFRDLAQIRQAAYNQRIARITLSPLGIALPQVPEYVGPMIAARRTTYPGSSSGSPVIRPSHATVYPTPRSFWKFGKNVQKSLKRA
ncbi:uncharacterized protein LOC127805648 [Diospyros lotus]|uniref:uncharacterized protein LOC127805648 n=1 Tax=Diospyros lotus TaxID=55363 RepID=UPI0022549B29|nr:uncharacterized protein LOC127805648 [Diospyros lotus]